MNIVKVAGLFLLVLVQASATAQLTDPKDLSVAEFKAALDSTSEGVLLDLRTEKEVNEGFIPNAIHIDFFEKGFEKKIGALNKDKVYFLYCASGGRSGETMKLMSAKGFNVYNLKGGFHEWKKMKMPVQK